MNNKPKIKDTKCRFGLTMEKKHKEFLIKEANRLGISLNSLFIMSALTQFPFSEDDKER